MTDSSTRASNRRTGLWIATVVLLMVGLSFASVPLYSMFCRVTGFGGTPLRAEKAPGADVSHGLITVRFNADIDPSLPWQFSVPKEKSVTVKPGEPFLVLFTAKNTGSTPSTGTATFNVTPLKASKYFNKIECFCFQEQTLKAGEEASFPVSFWVDPKIRTDVHTVDIDTVTLSYTFFKKVDAAALKGR